MCPAPWLPSRPVRSPGRQWRRAAGQLTHTGHTAAPPWLRPRNVGSLQSSAAQPPGAPRRAQRGAPAAPERRRKPPAALHGEHAEPTAEEQPGVRSAGGAAGFPAPGHEDLGRRTAESQFPGHVTTRPNALPAPCRNGPLRAPGADRADGVGADGTEPTLRCGFTWSLFLMRPGGTGELGTGGLKVPPSLPSLVTTPVSALEFVCSREDQAAPVTGVRGQSGAWAQPPPSRCPSCPLRGSPKSPGPLRHV